MKSAKSVRGRARRASGAAKFNGVDDVARIRAPTGHAVTLHQVQGVGVGAAGCGCVNGFNAESLGCIGRACHDGLDISNRCAGQTRVAVELDKGRGAGRGGQIAARGDADRIAS